MLKKRKAQWLFQVTCSVVHPSPAFAFTFLAKQLTKRGQGQALSCSYILDFQGPHPHTWLLPQLNVFEHSQCTCHNRSTSLRWDSQTLSVQEKIKSSHCAEDEWKHKFRSYFPQPAFGTSSIHNRKLQWIKWMSTKHEELAQINDYKYRLFVNLATENRKLHKWSHQLTVYHNQTPSCVCK